MLWVLAGNDLAPLPAPILDRLKVVPVPTPDGAHLRAVAASVYEEDSAARGRCFPPAIDEAVLAACSRRTLAGSARPSTRRWRGRRPTDDASSGPTSSSWPKASSRDRLPLT